MDHLRGPVRIAVDMFKDALVPSFDLSVARRLEFSARESNKQKARVSLLKVFHDVEARSVQDMLVLCGDGLTGLPDVVRSEFPLPDVQLWAASDAQGRQLRLFRRP